MNEKIKYDGFAVCQACEMSGHDADSCRANKLSNGLTMCITCGSYTMPIGTEARPVYGMPRKVKTLVAALLREPELHVQKLQLAFAQFGPDGSSSQAAAACAQGNEGVILNAGRLILSADRHANSKLEIRFQADELNDVPDFSRPPQGGLDEMSAQFLRNIKAHSCPPALEAAIGKLLAFGFTVRPLDYGSSMRRISLHCGGNIAGTAVPKGIMVEATYLV